MSAKVLCPFYKVERAGRMRMPAKGFCDNLRSGVPFCVIGGLMSRVGGWDQEFEESLMKMDYAEARKAEEARARSKPHCPSVVLSDLYDSVRPEFKKSGCFFGGLCVRPKSRGFNGCSDDCARWKDESE
jgi:hypothetical protein